MKLILVGFCAALVANAAVVYMGVRFVLEVVQ